MAAVMAKALATLPCPFMRLWCLSTFVPVTYTATRGLRSIDTCVLRPYLNNCHS